MNVLIIGSGGREHALAWKLKQSPRVERMFCAPGNPGMAAIAECAPIAPGDTRALLEFARVNKIGLAVVGPEQPLANGIAEDFQKAGIRLFGPGKRAAELEWSKAYAKEFMKRHGIPTAAFRTFSASQRTEAAAYLDTCPLPVVLKADGLASGKGVIVCATLEEARAALALLTDTVVIEEFLEGEEASVFALTDGYEYVTLAPAQDHKRALDGDQGLNTGGMGAYAPAPVVTPSVLEKVRRSIIGPTLRGMESEGRLYRGCLYIGLMITSTGPKVVEYNCRFGDPETQVVLPLYEGDILPLLLAACDGTIARLPEPAPPAGSAACIVLTSAGYPEAYETGKRIDGLDGLTGMPDVVVFHAGTKRDEQGALVTAGGRVLGVTAFTKGEAIASALAAAYDAVGKISFEGMHFRKDIGWRALTQRPAETDEA